MTANATSLLLNPDSSLPEATGYVPNEDDPICANAALHEHGRQILHNFPDEASCLNARQFMSHHRRETRAADLPLASPTCEFPPSSPNVWTDGSLTQPTWPFAALAGLGVWWPSRNTPPNVQEDDVCYQTDEPQQGRSG